jgi:hypothetical protein
MTTGAKHSAAEEHSSFCWGRPLISDYRYGVVTGRSCYAGTPLTKSVAFRIQGAKSVALSTIQRQKKYPFWTAVMCWKEKSCRRYKG